MFDPKDKLSSDLIVFQELCIVFSAADSQLYLYFPFTTAWFVIVKSNNCWFIQSLVHFAAIFFTFRITIDVFTFNPNAFLQI